MAWGWGSAEDNVKVLREGMAPPLSLGTQEEPSGTMAILRTGKRARILSCTKHEHLGQPGSSTSRASEHWRGPTCVAGGMGH